MNEFNSFKSQISTQEKIVRAEIKKLNELHAKRPSEEVKDYEFKNTSGSKKLSELFGTNEELILIHNMGQHCSYCALWADGFNGYYKQISTRAAFVVVNNDSPEAQQKFASTKQWTFPMYSCHGSSFFADMGFSEIKNEKENYWPGVSIFRKTKDGKIERTTSAGFGPGDLFSSIWHMIDLLPKGVNDWRPLSTN